MINDNAKKDNESLEHCSKFVQKFKELLKSQNELKKFSSIQNNQNSRRKKHFYITSKNTSNLPFIINHNKINNSSEKKEKNSFRLKFKLSPKKYLLNLDSLSHKKDTIFQFNEITQYLKNIKYNNINKDETNTKKSIKDHEILSEKKSPKNNTTNKKLGLTIYSNNKFNFNKFNINNKEQSESTSNKDIQPKEPVNQKIIIQSFTNIKNKNYSTKNYYIKNFNIEKEKTQTKIISRNTLFKSPSEIFKNELIKKQKQIMNSTEQLIKLKNSKSEKILFNSTDTYKINKLNIF